MLFHRALNIPAFLPSFGSEEQCAEAVYRASWPTGLCCAACDGQTLRRLCCRRAVCRCHHCKRQVSLPAGTSFAATTLLLTVWFLAVYLLSQAKNGISVLDLARQLGVSVNTACLSKY